MTTPANKPVPKKMPILARHAVSLAIAFVLGMVLSYFVGQYIYQQVQLSKLNSTDQATFERGVGYVLTHAGSDEAVTDVALDAVETLDPQHAADLLLAVTQSHANRGDVEEPSIPKAVNDAAASLMQRLDSLQAIGLYDGLVKIDGVDAVKTANALLAALNPKDDAELLQVVDLLDTRLLWSKQWAPLELWVRWLGVGAQSDSELTQYNTVIRLGDLPDAVDDTRIRETLNALASSQYERVRNKVLHVVAGYAAIAKDPTDYEQIIFTLGQDENKHIARRAWLIVGHLNPFSGFAVNWKDADPFVAEGMLWAAAKTNPENSKPILDALKLPSSKPPHPYEMASIGLLALSQLDERGFVSTEQKINYTYRMLSETFSGNLTTFWRFVLATNLDTNHSERFNFEFHAFSTSLIGEAKHLDEEQSDAYFAIRCACVYRLNARIVEDDILFSDQMHLLELAQTEGRILAPAFEGVIKAYYPISQLIAASNGSAEVDLDKLISDLPLSQSSLLDLFCLALTHSDTATIDRFISSSHPEMVTMAAIASVIRGHQTRLITGFDLDFPRRHPDVTMEEIKEMDDAELSKLGLSRTDALPALLEAAESAPPSANRAVEAKLLKLALWMRGDLGDSFTPTAEAMLLDEDLPTSTVLMCLLHKRRPIALDYLFGDLVTPRPDLHKLFVQERYWHVLRHFVDKSDLTLWLWGDPEAQAFQLEAMQQWYAVNRWKIERGWWPEVIDN